MASDVGRDERSRAEETRSCSQDSSSSSSSDDGDAEVHSDNSEFIRNRKERSTVLVRRFYKNNQKVFIFVTDSSDVFS